MNLIEKTKAYYEQAKLELERARDAAPSNSHQRYDARKNGREGKFGRKHIIYFNKMISELAIEEKYVLKGIEMTYNYIKEKHLDAPGSVHAAVSSNILRTINEEYNS